MYPYITRKTIFGSYALFIQCVMAQPSIVVTPLALQPGKGASYPWGYGTIGKYQPQQFRFFFDTSTNISFALIEGQLLNYRKVLATSYPPTILRALAVTEESPRTRICILDRS